MSNIKTLQKRLFLKIFEVKWGKECQMYDKR